MSVSVAATASKRLAEVRPQPRTMSVVIYFHDLAGGGVERQSLIIAEEFRRHGAHVTLVLHRLRGQLLEQVPSGLRIVDLKSSRTLYDVFGLARFLRAERPDILVSNVDLNNVAALLAKAISFSRTKVVICQHNPIASNYVQGGNPLYRYIGLAYRALSPWISWAVAVSGGVADELKAATGLPEDRVLTIYNPVVGPDFHARSDEPASHPWFQQPDVPLFVTAGRLVPQKDHEMMIRALAIHRRTHSGRLMILGSGPLADRLAGLVTELGLEDAVAFLGFQSNALPYFCKADAFVLSSRCEGFGNVIVEALGCGTPVIATRCNHGPAEILAGGAFGVLVEPGDADAMAAAMNEVSTLRQRFPAQVLRERAGEFSYAACASRYMAIFKAMVPNSVWVA